MSTNESHSQQEQLLFVSATVIGFDLNRANRWPHMVQHDIVS